MDEEEEYNKPCNRATCNIAKCTNNNNNNNRATTNRNTPSRTAAPLACPYKVLAPIGAAGYSTQVLYIEPNFTETPSEYDNFYDCYSDVESNETTTTNLKSSTSAPQSFKSVEPPTTTTSLASNTRTFRDALQQVIQTAQTLLLEFNKFSGRKERRGYGTRRRMIKPHTHTVQLEVTAKMTENKNATTTTTAPSAMPNIRIEPITFTIPLTLHVQGHTQQQQQQQQQRQQQHFLYTPSQQSYGAHMPRVFSELEQIREFYNSMEPIRTAIVTAPQRQHVRRNAKKCPQTHTHRYHTHLSGDVDGSRRGSNVSETLHLRIEPLIQYDTMSSCNNYPSNYRVIVETSMNNNAPTSKITTNAAETTTTTTTPTIYNNNQQLVAAAAPVQLSSSLVQQQYVASQRGFQQQQQQQQQQLRLSLQMPQWYYQQKHQQQQQPHQQPPNQFPGNILHHQQQPLEQQSSTSGKSTNGVLDAQDLQHTQAFANQHSTEPFIKNYFMHSNTSESGGGGGQLSCGCPFEISITSGGPTNPQATYELRLASGMTAMWPVVNDEEFYSLSSASSERDDVPVVARKATKKSNKDNRKCRCSTRKRNEFTDCECTPPTQAGKKVTSSNKNNNNNNNTPQRNAAILQLLSQVVQLIDPQSDESGGGRNVRSCPGNEQPTKIRNIGALDEDAAAAENGPFSTGLQLTFTPSHKDTSQSGSNMRSERSETPPPTQNQQQQMAVIGCNQAINIPLQLPCKLIITPDVLTCAPCSSSTTQQALMAAPQSMPIMAATATDQPTTIHQPTTTTKCAEQQAEKAGSGCDYVRDIELIEEIAALVLAADPKDCAAAEQRSSSQPSNARDHHGGGGGRSCNGTSERSGKPCLQQCICNRRSSCPVHGIVISPPPPSSSTTTARNSSQLMVANEPQEEEEEPELDMAYECMDGDGEETIGIITEPSQSQTHISTETSALTSRTKRSNVSGSACLCCHCQAMREKEQCMAIAKTTTDKSRKQCNCNELKFFIDSIIMDLDAMEKARRKKRVEQNTKPTRASICPRKSFPVTITEVTELGTSSLYVKWVIHDCCGIGGYEIYVDGYLTNRYFHCNHEAAVVCDVDVTRPHKVVLVAQPKQSAADSNWDDDMENKGKALMRKGDAERMNGANIVTPNSQSALWMPSIYLYDPCVKKVGPPIMRDGGAF